MPTVRNHIGSMTTNCGSGTFRVTNNVYSISFAPTKLVIRGVDMTYAYNPSLRRPNPMPRMKDDEGDDCYNLSSNYGPSGCEITAGCLNYVERTGTLTFASTRDVAGLIIAGKDISSEVIYASGMAEVVERAKQSMVKELAADVLLAKVELAGDAILTAEGAALNGVFALQTYSNSKFICNDKVKIQRLRIDASGTSSVSFADHCADSSVGLLRLGTSQSAGVVFCPSCKRMEVDSGSASSAILVGQKDLEDLKVDTCMKARAEFHDSKIPAYARLSASMDSYIVGYRDTIAVDPSTVETDVCGANASISGILGMPTVKKSW